LRVSNADAALLDRAKQQGGPVGFLNFIADRVVDGAVGSFELLAKTIDAGQDLLRGGDPAEGIESVKGFDAPAQLAGLEERWVGFALRDEIVWDDGQ
jgi:hypothetical protein